MIEVHTHIWIAYLYNADGMMIEWRAFSHKLDAEVYANAHGLGTVVKQFTDPGAK